MPEFHRGRMEMHFTTSHGNKAGKSLTKALMPEREGTITKVNAKKALRRNQSKLNQRRYRAEQKAVLDHLNGSVSCLAMEVARLEGRVESLRMAVPINLRTFAPETKVVQEYFRLFEKGYCQQKDNPMHNDQHEFVNSTFNQDLVFMENVGLDKLFLQWTMYTTIFESVYMECSSSRVNTFSPDVMLESQAVMHLRISRLTIEAVFPHLLGDEVSIQRLIGRTLRLPVLCHFFFDQSCRIQRFNTHANPTVALYELLENLQETEKVMSGFLLRDNAEIIAPRMMIEQAP